jgi:hypothetical protein
MRHIVRGSAASVGATLLKTGQTTSYRTGDDGDLEKGRATSFFVLGSNNPFGNTNRFTDELGGTTYTNNIVIDWSTYDGSTVLGYRRTRNGSLVTWDNAIDGAAAVSIGTFTTGWRLPNIHELTNLNNSGSFPLLNYSPINLNLAGSDNLWSSSTIEANAGFAYWGNYLGYSFQAKTSTAQYIPCRTFTVTGTTLS